MKYTRVRETVDAVRDEDGIWTVRFNDGMQMLMRDEEFRAQFEPEPTAHDDAQDFQDWLDRKRKDYR